MTDTELDTTKELRPKRKERGKVDPIVSPLRPDEASYPQVAEAELADIDDPTVLKIAEMWANEVADHERPTMDALIARARETDKPHGLHAKLAEVMHIAKRIPKRGVAPKAMGGYTFVQVGDAADFVREELSTRRVTMLPEAIDVVDDGLAGTVFVQSDTRGGGKMTTFTIKVTWRLTDADSGESTTIQSLGTGADTGDKFSPKAQTNAMKYAFLTGFLLSTGDDPEAFDLSDGALQVDPTIGDSSVTGVQQGGRQTLTTAPQLDAIRRLVSTKKLSADELLAEIEAGVELTPEQEARADDYDSALPEDAKRKAVMALIGEFSFGQAGNLIGRLEEQASLGELGR